MNDQRISFPIRDCLIAAVSVAMLVWAVWPRLPDQRIVHVMTNNGTTQAFALLADDERLPQIQSRIDAWKVREPLAKLGHTRWALQTAKHYAQLRSQRPAIAKVTPKSKEVLPASFTLPGTDGVQDKPAPPAAPDPATIDWQSVAKRQSNRMQSIQASISAAKARLGPPPFAISPVQSGGRSHWAIAVGGFAGLVAFFGVGFWHRVAPPIRLDLGARLQSSDFDPRRENPMVAMRLPAEWLHLHQPLAVVARAATVAGLFVAGVIAVWIY